MMQFMADAFVKVEELIATVSAGMPESAKPKMRTDPDDPWASTINVPNAVYKVRMCGCCVSRQTHARALPSRVVVRHGTLEGCRETQPQRGIAPVVLSMLLKVDLRSHRP
jgi:hypothetical protein